MSIDQLAQDLKGIASKAGDLATIDDVKKYLQEELLAWLESFVQETAEMDMAIEAVVDGAEDMLHSESSQVFTGLIASGAFLVRELETRIGNDQRIHKLIKEYKQVSKEAAQLLEEITIPDPDPDPADGEPEPEPEAEGSAQ